MVLASAVHNYRIHLLKQKVEPSVQHADIYFVLSKEKDSSGVEYVWNYVSFLPGLKYQMGRCLFIGNSQHNQYIQIFL